MSGGGMTKVGTGAKLEDSNIALYGSKDHKDAKLNAAKTETAWEGAGKKVGVEVWRIEKFKVVRQEEGKNGFNFGSFFSGDAYIILNSYKSPENQEKMLYNVHFWLGAECSQDEQGTAAYKTVELDDLLGDLPVQFREVQGHESEQFIALFPKGIKLMKGGVDSGFNKVKPTEYKPRLMHIKGSKKIRVEEVALGLASLNQGDTFILDLGMEFIQWNGPQSSIHEKRKAAEIVAALIAERGNKGSKTIVDGIEKHPTFWKTLGAAGGAPPAKEAIAAATSDDVKFENKKVLFELSDKSGTLTMTKVSEGHPKKSELKTEEVFILDTGEVVFAWIGNGASKEERASAIKRGTEYLASQGRPAYIQVQRVCEGKEPKAFLQNF